jgi:hypothetical protein
VDGRVLGWGDSSLGPEVKIPGNKDIFHSFVLPDPQIPVVSWISGNSHVIVVRADHSVYGSGSNLTGQLKGGDDFWPTIEKIPDFRAATGRHAVQLWQEVMQWIFLGISDVNSGFSGVPIEVAYHLVRINV